MPDEKIDILLKRLSALDPKEPDSQFEAAIALPKTVTAENRAAIVSALMGALKMPHSLTRAHAAEGLGFIKSRRISAGLDCRVEGSLPTRALLRRSSLGQNSRSRGN